VCHTELCPYALLVSGSTLALQPAVSARSSHACIASPVLRCALSLVNSLPFPLARLCRGIASAVAVSSASHRQSSSTIDIVESQGVLRCLTLQFIY
jgi:hypothetical protein